MKKKISKTTRSILSFVLAAAMVMGLSGISTFAAEVVESDSTTGDEAVEVFSATEENQTLNVIEQAADESASDVTYTFHLYQITGKTGEIETMSDITVSEAGADLSYYIIDTNTNEEIAYETTDENGSFELGADECAQFTLPAETDWYVDQDTPEAYPLIDVTADGDHASVVDSVNGVVQYDTEESEPTTVDKSALQAEYDSDLSYNEDDYTPESWEAFEDAMEHAKEVLDDPGATQEEVDEALDELEKAREGLEPAGDEPEPTPEPEPDTVEVTGEKTWDDANDQDGMRPENITVNLLADGEQTDSATVTADQDGKWTYSFTDLPEYGENGDEITYTVTEDAVANYETKIDGYDITNTYTPETMSIHGTKVWVDNEDQDGVRPDTVTVRLLANGEEADSTTASEATGWAWSFDDLAVYEDGTAIQYYVVEDTVADYTTTYDYNRTGTDDFDVTITNTHTPDETNITVLKVWSDADDQDGKRPGEVTVELLTDGVATGQTLTLSAANDWTDTFTGLPKYHDEGEAYNYSVEELSVDGYTSTRYEVTDEAYVFVNEYTPEQTAVTVNKKWDDGDNHDNARPESVAVTLFADDEAVASMSLTDAGNWAGTFTSLPAYKDHGQAIEYKVSEEEVSGYTAEVTGNAAEGFTITNTHMYTSTIDIPVTKVWEDENNNDGERPENVTVSLINKVTEEMVQTLTLSEDNKWTDSFTNVDPEAEYTVTEEEVEGYEAAIDGDQSDGFTITNTHVYGTVDVSVEKEWVDNDNEDGTRPDSVTVHLWNADTETHLGSATLNEENDWQYTFDPQPKYASGEEINYEVTEETVAGYTSDISQSTDEDGCPVFTITNTCLYEDTIDITGTKVWNDESDQDGLRPDHVTIELLADGTVVNSKDITPYTTLTFAAPSPIAAFLAAEDVNEWNFSFKDLPKYNADGSKIDYTIAELAVEDYESTVITGDMTDGFTITNTHTPATITVSGTKTWDDAGDQDGVRPSTVDVYLTIDGERVEEGTGNYVTAVLNADNGWTYSFDNLDKCANGKAIEYGVEEAEVPGYEATYAAATDAGGNYTIDITNTRGTATVNYTVTKIWDDADDQDADQPTSVTVRLLANGDEVDYMNLTANEDWTGTFTDLPKYEDGQEITYTVTEDPVKDYETTYSTPMVDTEGNYSCEITNTHAPDKETLTINKVWADNGDQDGIRPESIDVNVLHVDEDTNEVVDTLTLAGDGDVWTATLDVDAYENGGQEIHYTVEEPEVPNGYEVTYGDADPLTIINTHTPETTDVTVDKVWDDNDNQDGVQHEVVTVRLYANGTEVASDNIAAVDDWTYTFTDLPKYENGEPITYTVTEDAMSDYTPAITGSVENGFTITNTHTPGETSVSVTKAWDDGNDQDGLQPESVTVSLLADGTATDKTLELNEDNSWTGTFTSLDEYQNGSKVNYTVEEEAVTGYTTEVNGDATEGYTITNTHTPETIDVTGQKVWEDNNNQDGTRPDSIIVMLYADGAPASDEYGNSLSAIVTDENGWNFAFTGLPKYEFDEDGNGGKEIVYTIEEFAAPEGYTSEVTGDVEDGFTVTNSLTAETGFTVSVDWVEDDAYEEAYLPTSITVTLYADGEPVLDDNGDPITVTLSEENDWAYEFTDLPKYEDGKKINYSVEVTAYNPEGAGSYYTPEVTTDDDGNITITMYQKYFDLDEEIVPDEGDRATWEEHESVNAYNAIEIEMSTNLPDMSGEELADGEYSILFHDELASALVLDENAADFKVTIGGETISSAYYTITLADGTSPARLTPFSITINDDCSFHVEVDLSALYNDGVISDEDLQGDTELMLYFFADLEGTDLNGSFTSTAWYEVYSGDEVQYTSEQHVVEVTTYEIEITKYDASQSEEAILPGATLGVYYDGDCANPVIRNGAPYTAVSGENGIAVFYGLAEGIYYIQEIEAPIGYSLSDEVLEVDLTALGEDEYVFYGEYANEPLAPVEISGTKTWDDNDDQDGMRPASVTVNLLANDEPALDASGNVITATVTADDKIDDNTWSYSFTDLPQVTDDGIAITYTVTEDAVEGYDTSIDGYDITNTHEPEMIEITGEKVWDDNDNQDGARPDFITIHLMVGDEEIAKQTITEDDDLAFDFGAQPKYADGEKIDYTVTETVPSSLPDGTYTLDIEESETDDGLYFTLTNSHTPETITIQGTKVWLDSSDQDGERPDEVTVYLYAAGASGTSVSQTTVSKETEWAWSFGELPVYDSGIAIQYSVVEEAVTDYTATYDYDMEAEGIFDVTITNTHTPGETSLTVIKFWDDEDDAAGFRPESVEMELLQDGAVYATAELSEEDNWQYTFTGLPAKHEHGTEYTYTVQEVPASGSVYTTSDPEQVGETNAYVITNKYTPEETKVTVEKEWEDNDDQDGIRPASVTVSLLANGDVVDKATLNDADHWFKTFGELPVYADGEEITYTVEESDVPAGYETVVSDLTGDAENGYEYTITNTHTPETIDISGTKVWLDNDNQDGKRPTDITINLLADGVQVDLKDVRDPDVHPARLVTPLIKILRDSAEETEDWTWSFEGLPKYANGEEIVYTVEEEPVDGYETYIQGDMTTGFQIFNTHTPEQIDISVEKDWDDADDQDGLRPAYITVQLLTDETVVDDQIVVADADGDWGCTFTVDKYADGAEIAYDVNEILPESVAEDTYTTDITGNVEDGFTITNTHEPATIDITIAKEWDDADDQDGKRPDEITVGIFAGATWVDDATLTAEENWATVTFENLPAYANGEKIQYVIYEDEEGLDGYTADADITTDEETGDISCTITNSYTPEETGVMVTKVWKDGDNQDGKRPETVTVNLLADGVQALDENDDPITAELSEDNDWTCNFTDLPDYEHGDEIEYSVEEVAVDGYDTEIIPIENANEFIIVNSYTPETIDVAVDKTWDDREDQDGKRPASITYRLLADGDEVDEWNAVASEGWAHTFADVARYADGKEIAYTVTEDAVADYTTSIDSSKDAATGDYTVSVTNTHDPEMTDVHVVKVWDDNDDQDGLRPEKVTVNLLAENEVVDTAVLSDESATDEDGNWTYKFENLPVYADGEKITYTVTEDAVDGYECTMVESTDEDGCPVCTITNTHEPETIAIAGEKVWDDEDNQDGVRPDYIIVHLLADGDEVDSKTITDSNADWTFDFGELPVYADGDEITYTLTETLPASADGVYEEPVITSEETEDGIYFTVTNTHTPETIAIHGTKVWEDSGNQDGERPDEITISLTANGQTVASIGVTEENETEDNVWVWAFEDQPVYEEGVAIQYHVVEGDIDDYTATYTYEEDEVPAGSDVAYSYNVTITNTHTPDTTSLDVIKIWDDDNDSAGFRPESVVVELYRADAEGGEATATGQTLTLSGENNWHDTFVDLPKNHDSGTAYVYSVQEVTEINSVYSTDGPNSVEGSTTAYSFTNTYVPETENIVVEKVWDDADDQDGYRPASITVNLLANDEVAKETTLTAADADADGNWAYTFEGLPVYANGEAIEYTVTETMELDEDVPTDAYTTEITYGTTTVDEDTIPLVTITNTHEPETIDIEGIKIWVDNDNQDNIRPDEVTINILADGEPALDENGEPIIVTISEATTWNPLFAPIIRTLAGETENRWEWSLTRVLPKYKDGVEIAYTIEEDPVDGYETYTEGDMYNGFEIYNIHETDKVEVTGTKIWVDDDNSEGLRPDYITIHLYAGDEEIDHQTITAEDDWTFDFMDLDEKADGEDIVYTITESMPEDAADVYTSSIKQVDEDGYVYEITNTLSAETSITVNVDWIDNDDEGETRPESVEVTLCANGVAYGESVTLTADDWTNTWEDLPVYDEHGARITYTVEYEAVESYDAVLEYNEETDTYTITYTLTRPVEIYKYTGEAGDLAVRIDADDPNANLEDEAFCFTATATGRYYVAYKLATGDQYFYLNSDVFEASEVAENVYLLTGGIGAASGQNNAAYIDVVEGETYFIHRTSASSGTEYTGPELCLIAEENYASTVPTEHAIDMEVGYYEIPTETPLAGAQFVLMNDAGEYGMFDEDGNFVEWTEDYDEATILISGEDGLINLTGVPIGEYALIEVAAPEGYAPLEESIEVIVDGLGDTVEVTVENDPEEIEITGEKVWDDNDDQDGMRPNEITVNLMDGETVIDTTTVSADADGEWNFAFTADKYDTAGGEIAYTVSEVMPESVEEGTYTADIEGNAESGFTITNTHEPATIDITIEKIWVDEDDQDGKRPDEITVGIFAGATWVDDATLTAEKNWAPVTFENLPAYANGEKIQYVIYEDEEGLDGYTADADITTDEETGDISCTITNSYTPEETGVMVTKVWNDGDNQDGKRPETVTVNLLADDEPALDENDEPITAELSDANDWTYNFTGLPDYEHGDEIEYSVEEVAVEDYDTEIIDITNANEFIIVNSYTPETIDITGEKIWEDNNDLEGLRPAYITIHLMVDEEEIAYQRITAEDDWTFAFTDLDKYADGAEIEYTLTETMLSDAADVYVSSGFEEVEEGSNVYTVTNTLRTYPVDIYKYTGTESNLAIRINEDDPDADLEHEAFCFTAPETGRYYVAYELSGGTSYHFLSNTVFEQSETAENVYLLTGGITQGGNKNNTAYIDVVEGEDYFIHRTSASSGTDYSGPQLCLIAEDKFTSSTVPTEHAIDMEVGYYEIPEETPLAGAQFVLTKERDGQTVKYAVFDEDGALLAWTEDESEATILTSGEDGYIHLTGLAVGDYSLIEVAAPTGYELIEEPIEATIGDAEVLVEVDVENEPATTDVHVEKVWDDNNDQDGMRPEYVTVNLLADGEQAYDEDDEPITATLSDANDWTSTFEDLPAFDEDSEEIIYTVEEADVPDGYACTIAEEADEDGHSVYTIVNTHEPETIEITGKKVWDDEENQDGVRPDYIILQLLADEESVDDASLTLTDTEYKGDEWEFTFGEYPKYADGEEIEYSVEETLPPTLPEDTYEMTIGAPEETDDGICFEITNTHVPATITIEGEKIWDDNDDVDGERPTSVIVNLVAVGSETTSTPKTVSAAVDDWTWSFEGLPVYENGVAIQYYIAEDDVEDYTATYEYDMVGEGDYYVTITNTHAPKETSVNVVKFWDDDDNSAGFRPDSIEIELLADGIVSDTLTMSGDGNLWTDAFTGLPKYHDHGEEIKYAVQEVVESEADYTASYTHTEGSAVYAITNSYTPETVDVTGSKTWDDKDNQDGKRPESITISLLADGNETASQTVTAADGWSWSFIDLPKYKDGVEITYTIAEDAVAGYETTIDGYDVTNSYESGKTSLNVQKIWEDADDQDGVRPNDITVELTKNGTATGDKLTLDESSGWAGSFTDLDEYTDGVKNEYSVAEVSVDGYTPDVETVEGTSTIVITNEHKPETVDIPVTKVWEDEDNQDGSRPDEITFRVWNGNTMVDSATIEPEADGSWLTYTFEDLPKYANGEEIAYVVTEDSVDNYSTEVTGSMEDGFTVTNSHTPEQTSISVFKVWDDNGDQDDTRPESITVNLLADGAETDKTLTLNEDNSWMGSFTVDKYEDGGIEVVYTVAEDQVDGYSEPVITGDASIGYIITNTLDTVRLHGSVIWVDDSNESEKRPESVTINILADGEQAYDDKGDAISITVSGDEVSPTRLSVPLIKMLAADENEWYWSVSDLPKYNGGGNEIVYTVEQVTEVNGEELEFAKYYDTYTQGDAADGYEIFNVIKPMLILTLVDSTDGVTPLADGIFTLYRVSEDGYEAEVVEEGLTTDENGQIILDSLDAGDYYFEQTAAPSGYVMPVDAKSETFTITDTKVYEITIENDPVTVKYAVKIWGIEADTYSYDDGDTTHTAGLTFGPATGANYTNDSVAHMSEDACDPENGSYCIHWMSWDEIIAQSKVNPSVFEDCMEAGCTKAVELTPNWDLFNLTAATNEANLHFTGDGVGTLDYELNRGSGSNGHAYYAYWSYFTTYATEEHPANVYSCSRIRTTLNGDDTNIQKAIADGADSRTYYNNSGLLATESNCLFSCFPDELQEAIVPRTTYNSGHLSVGSYKMEDETTYDKLWLFSLKEIGLSNTYDDSGGVDYGIARSGSMYNNDRVVYGINSSNSVSSQLWWTRSRYAGDFTSAFAISGGSTQTVSSSAGYGLSPGFCLPGPDEEVDEQTGYVDYAVKLWGICTDTYSEDGGDTTDTASLTFGPALGKSYLNSHEDCGSDTCIHNLSWNQIIAYCNEYQGNEEKLTELFGSCLENGCTKTVTLTTNNTLFDMETVNNAMEQGYAGDGVSTLSHLLKTEDSAQTGLFWNLTDISTSKENPSNVYTHSRVQTSLTGESTYITQWLDEHYSNFYYDDSHPLLTEKNCLFSCFPENLQKAIAPREVKVSFTVEDRVDPHDPIYLEETTYDTLWLLSCGELGLSVTSNDGTDYGIVNSDAERVAYEYSSAEASDAEPQACWTRSRDDAYDGNTDEHIVYKIQSDGTSIDSEPNAGNGISPAFCLK